MRFEIKHALTIDVKHTDAGVHVLVSGNPGKCLLFVVLFVSAVEVAKGVVRWLFT